MPIFGIIIGVIYFFLLNWRHMQLLGMTLFCSFTDLLLVVHSGTLVATLTLCYPW